MYRGHEPCYGYVCTLLCQQGKQGSSIASTSAIFYHVHYLGLYYASTDLTPGLPVTFLSEYSSFLNLLHTPPLCPSGSTPG